MMGDLKINYDKADSVGGQIIAYSGDLSSLLTDIEGINARLESLWQGQDASKYASAVEQQANVIRDLVKTIESTGQFMKTAAEAYRQAEEANASAING